MFAKPTNLLGDYGWTPNEMRELDRYYAPRALSAQELANYEHYQALMMQQAQAQIYAPEMLRNIYGLPRPVDVPTGWSDWYAHGHELH